MLNALTRCITAAIAFGCLCCDGIRAQESSAQPALDPRRAAAGTELFVSPDGTDSNPGTLERPLASPESARDRIRAIRREHPPAGGVTVWLRGGRYRLSGSFLLSREDSGMRESPIEYRARPGETVTITGGIDLPRAAWVPVDDAAVRSRIISEEARGHVRQVDLKALGVTNLDPIPPRGFPCPVRPAPMELFVGGAPMTLARWPNDGFVMTGPVSGPGAGPGSVEPPAFRYADGRPSLWLGAKDVWLLGYWKFDWAEESIPVKSIDAEAKQITLAHGHVYGVDPGKPYYAENLLEEIDRPGEYYIDRDRGVLYCWLPETGGTDATIRLSVDAQPLITATDASWLTLRGLTFEESRGDAVCIRGGEGVRIVDCAFRNLGNRAVVVEGGSDHAVVGCEIHDTGEGGISLSGGDRATLTPAHHAADDNEIYRYNRRGFTYRPAIGISGVGCRASHNLIHDAPHSAILFWGNDHTIEYNEIHHVLALTGDGGAVYTGRDWTFRGNIIRCNYFHDIRGMGKWENAVYIDDQAGGIRITDNIFRNCHWGMLLGGGRDMTIENNIFWGCDLALQLDARGLGWGADQLGPTLRTNLAAMPYTREPWASRYPQLVNIEQDEPMVPKHNVIRNNILVKSGRVDARIEPAAKQNAQVSGNIESEEDPGFVDGEGGKFDLAPGSSITLRSPEFRPVSLKEVGPRKR